MARKFIAHNTHQIFGLGDFKGVYKHLSNFLTKSFELTLKSFFLLKLPQFNNLYLYITISDKSVVFIIFNR